MTGRKMTSVFAEQKVHGGNIFDQNWAATWAEIREFQKAAIDLDCFVTKVSLSTCFPRARMSEPVVQEL